MSGAAKTSVGGKAESVRLRDIEAADLPALFQIQLEPEGCLLAGVIPRDETSFHAHWSKILAERIVVAKAIIADGILVGSISCFQQDGKESIGYWLAKEHWGRGIASRALAMLLEEVTQRPLHATAAASNAASIRVLERCGFRMTGTHTGEETERYLRREVATFLLE